MIISVVIVLKMKESLNAGLKILTQERQAAEFK
jgi:hypothetical protein